ncbi:MAG TPA: hypothetical protein EYG85_04210 [Crocinitomix sp.]|nr:hypothetical protein [Crocinitomix sp.]
MKIITLILAFIISVYSHSQEITRVFSDTTNQGHEIEITSFNYYASNSFNNELTDKFIKGGEITQSIKDFNQSKLGKLNSFGGEIEQRILYFNYDITPLKNRPNLGLVFSLEDVNYISTNISSDLFNTIFYGNQNYLGDTMDFSFSHAQYIHYQKIGFGLLHKKYKSYLKVDFLLGNRLENYRLGDTWMYSSSASDSIKFNLNAEGYSSDTIKSYFDSKGYGFSFDFEHNFIYVDKKKRSQVINIKLSNFGVIFWDKNTRFTYVDSANVFSGFEITDLLSRDSSSAPLYSTDTLGFFNGLRQHAEVLPFEISIQKLANRYSSQKLQFIFGLKALISSDYRPYGFFGAYYSPISSLGLSTRLAYGGFGGLKLGLSANYFIKNKFQVHLGTYDLIGFILPKYGFGKSLNISMNIKF